MHDERRLFNKKKDHNTDSSTVPVVSVQTTLQINDT